MINTVEESPSGKEDTEGYTRGIQGKGHDSQWRDQGMFH